MLGVSTFHQSQVVADATFRRTQLIDEARHLYEALANGVEPQGSGGAGDGALTTLRLLQTSCDLTRFETNWSSALHGLAIKSLPFLDPEAATGLLDAILPAACLESAPAQLRAWIALYRAVAERNAQHMAHTAEALLAVDAAQDPGRGNYALVAAMLGNLADGHDKRVLELWDQHRSSVGDLDALPEVRLIISIALSRTCGAGCQDPLAVTMRSASDP
jgi:hypothetical protein